MAVKSCRGTYSALVVVSGYKLQLVKLLLPDLPESLFRHEVCLREELQVMMKLKPHDNIVNLLGYSCSPGKLEAN